MLCIYKLGYSPICAVHCDKCIHTLRLNQAYTNSGSHERERMERRGLTLPKQIYFPDYNLEMWCTFSNYSKHILARICAASKCFFLLPVVVGASCLNFLRYKQYKRFVVFLATALLAVNVTLISQVWVHLWFESVFFFVLNLITQNRQTARHDNKAKQGEHINIELLWTDIITPKRVYIKDNNDVSCNDSEFKDTGINIGWFTGYFSSIGCMKIYAYMEYINAFLYLIGAQSRDGLEKGLQIISFIVVKLCMAYGLLHPSNVLPESNSEMHNLWIETKWRRAYFLGKKKSYEQSNHSRDGPNRTLDSGKIKHSFSSTTHHYKISSRKREENSTIKLIFLTLMWR